MASFFPINAPLVNYLFYNYTNTQQGPSLPVAGGKVFFFEDENHLAPKATYADVSSPDDPVINTNPIVLNDVGAWPLFYAETGLYYIVITGPDGDLDNPIWTFEHVDFAGGAGSSGENITNFISNGQFLLHTDLTETLPATDTLAAGQIRAGITPIAYGGWTFNRPDDSTAKDFVTFERYTEYSDNPDGNPRYAVRVKCTQFDSGDSFKDIRNTIPNVNRFASPIQGYTFSFSGMDETSGSISVDLYLIKNFGTGGDAETQTLLSTFNLTPTVSDFVHSFVYGENTGKVIGANDDDYIQLALRFPTDQTVDVLITDCLQQSGSISTPVYPETTQREDVSSALGGAFPIPNPDGSDLYLQPRLTKTGWEFDNSNVGKVCASGYLGAEVGELYCDGARYDPAAYSTDGIPYKRLWNKLFNTTFNVPLWGTGTDYVTSYTNNVAGQVRIWTNTTGAVTNSADGAAPTGFTFATLKTGASYGFLGHQTTTGLLFINSLTPGLVVNVDPGTSGFTTDPYRNSVADYAITTILPTDATGLAGKYFLISQPAVNYYVWFKVDSVGTDPAVAGRTGIEVDLLSTFDLFTVGAVIAEALAGNQITNIIMTDATTIPVSSYFDFSSTQPKDYYVWYTKDGVGTDPQVASKIGIQVNILGADTATQVASKSAEAINSKYFAVPDLRGAFLRGFDPTGVMDTDIAQRFSPFGIYVGVLVGQSQFDEVYSHAHRSVDGNPFTTYAGTAGANPGTGTGINNSGSQNTLPTGGSETRPINTSVNYIIKY